MRISFGADLERGFSLDELLPMRFGPGDLVDLATTPLLLDPQSNSIALSEGGHPAPTILLCCLGPLCFAFQKMPDLHSGAVELTLNKVVFLQSGAS